MPARPASDRSCLTDLGQAHPRSSAGVPSSVTVRYCWSRAAVCRCQSSSLLPNSPADHVGRFGIMTDLHYADKVPEQRDTIAVYRQSSPKPHNS